ncbi:hypothetical protein LCGC14_0871590 [marine sediment metagenome]|uniref:Uncharacterized protein n=1 Tax=marine sediment metagenome TaxID=412755 RepID=A0A0F9RP64_9ZZZZ
MGQRSPYADGLASPQAVFETNYTINEVLPADLTGTNKVCLIAYNNNVINSLQYDQNLDQFTRLTPLDFAPDPVPRSFRYVILERKILKATKLCQVNGQDVILVVGYFRILGLFGHLNKFDTVFVLRYNNNTWEYLPLSTNNNETL